MDYPIDNYSFINAIIYQEFNIPNDDNAKNRIDIAILDPESEIAIFIENKTGAKEHEGQTVGYRKSLSKEYKKYTCFFIFMDIEEEKAKDEGWFSVDYSWLTEAIEYLLDMDALPANIKHILLDYYSSIGDSEEKRGFFKKPYKLLTKVVKNHENFINEIKNIKQCEPKDIFGCYDRAKEPKQYIQYLLLEFKTFFEVLFEYTKWDYIEANLIKKIRNKDLEYSVYKNRLVITHDDFKESAKDIDDTAYYFKLFKRENEIIISFRVYRPNLKEEYMSVLDKDYTVGKYKTFKTKVLRSNNLEKEVGEFINNILKDYETLFFVKQI